MKEVVKIDILYQQFPCCMDYVSFSFGTVLITSNFNLSITYITYKIMYFVRENSNLRESGREEKQQIEEREENL